MIDICDLPMSSQISGANYLNQRAKISLQDTYIDENSFSSHSAPYKQITLKKWFYFWKKRTQWQNAVAIDRKVIYIDKIYLPFSK